MFKGGLEVFTGCADEGMSGTIARMEGFLKTMKSRKKGLTWRTR